MSGEMSVSDLMTTDVVTLTEDETLEFLVNGSPGLGQERLLRDQDVSDAEAADSTIGIAVTGYTGYSSGAGWEYYDGSSWASVPTLAAGRLPAR